MSKQGILLSVAGDQEGATPRIVTETQPMPINVINLPNETINHDFYNVDSSFSLLSDAISQDVVINIDTPTGIIVGDQVHIYDDVDRLHEHDMIFVTAVNGNAITLNRPIDHDYSAATATFEKINTNMSVLGTLVSPVSYKLQAAKGEKWHMTSIGFSMISPNPMDDAKFSSIAQLTNGVIIRYVDVIKNSYITFSAWQKNSDFKRDAFQTEYSAKAPAGFYGYSGALNVLTEYGAAVELSNYNGENNYIEVLIQDDLIDGVGSSIRIKAHGYVRSIQ